MKECLKDWITNILAVIVIGLGSYKYFFLTGMGFFEYVGVWALGFVFLFMDSKKILKFINQFIKKKIG